MEKLPQHGEMRIVSKGIFPKTLQKHRAGWFEMANIRQVYLDYGDFGVWSDTCFVTDSGENLGDPLRHTYHVSGRNPPPLTLRPNITPSPQNVRKHETQSN